MAKYNVTGYTNFQDFLGGANDVSGGWFWSFMLLGVGIVIFAMIAQRTTSERAFITASLGTWLFGTFIFYLGWINWLVYFLTIICLVASIVSAIVRQDNEY